MHSTGCGSLPRTTLSLDRLLWIQSVTGDTRLKSNLALRLGFSLACMLLMAHAVQAASFSSVQSGAWDDTATWGAASFPGSGDTVTINNGHTVTVTGSQGVLNLTVTSGGGLSLGSGSTVSVSGTTVNTQSGSTISGSGLFQTQGIVDLDNRGTFSAPLSVLSGTTTVEGGVATTFDGPISVAGSATLDTVQSNNFWTVVANGDVNISAGGTLSGLNTFSFFGSTFSNNGNVSVVRFEFDRNGAQSLAGTGTWTGGSLSIGDPSNTVNSTTSLANAVTFAVGTVNINNGDTLSVTAPLTINGANFNNNTGGTLSLSAALTYDGGATPGKQLLNNGTINGSGALQTQGAITIDTRTSFSAPLSVLSGTTTVEDSLNHTATFGGAITVGATLDTVQSNNFWTVVANGDVNVSAGGTLSGLNTFSFFGSTFSNNGNVSVVRFGFGRNGAQTLLGSGAFVSNTVTVVSGSTTTLASNHQLSSLTIDSGGSFDITSRTLGVSGSGRPVTNNGTFTTAASTIVYNGTNAQDAQTINTNWDYNNLTIDNAAGVSLNSAEVIPGTLTLTNGLFSHGGNLTMGNGALISRSNGSLASAPTFGASVNVEYTETNPLINITTGAELPSSSSVLGNLTINNSGGVSLNSSSTVNGTLALTNGTFSNGANLTLATGANILRDNGSLGAAPTFGASVHVNYVGTTAVTTGPEIPASASILGNLTINKSGGVNLGAGGAAVNGTFALSSGTFAVGSNTLTLNNATSVGSGTLTSGVTGTVIYNQGTDGQGVIAASYGNLMFSNTNKVLPASGTVGIAGAFSPGSAGGHTITGSTVDFNGPGSQTIPAFNYNSLGSSNSGTRTLAASGTVGVAGAFAPGTNSYTNTGSTIDFNGAGSQTIPAFNYFNLSSTSSGARTLAGSGVIGIAGNFVPGVHSYAISASTVEFNGSGVAQSLPAAFTTYNNLTLNNGAGTTGFAGLSANGLLEVKAGTFTGSSTYHHVQIDNGATLAATAGGTINVSGNWANNGSFSASTGTVNCNGSAAQTIGGSSPTTFNDLSISNTSGGVSLNQDVQINGSLTLTSGALSIGAHSLTINGAISSSGGTLAGGVASNITFGGSGASTSLPAVQNGLNTLTINRANGVSLAADLTVVGTLILTAGDLTTGSSTLTMPNTATSSGTTDVVGNVKRTGFTAGVPLSFGNPFTSINFQSGTLPVDVNVNLAKTIPAGFPAAVARTYLITPNGGSGFTATLRLHYLDAELGSNTEGASLSLRRFNGSSWDVVPATAFDTTANWSESNAVTQFSPWTLSSAAPTAAPATISGRVTNSDGTPLAGVLVTLTGGPQVRRAISDAAGMYSFTNLDTNAFYTVSPQRANYLFSPGERSFSLLANKTDAQFSAAQTIETANPLDTPEFFVRQQYLDFLNREPEQAGLDYWSGQLRNCATDEPCINGRRIGVSAAFFVEEEFQRTGSFVYRLYKASLGRQPNYGEFTTDRAKVIGGASLAENQQAFADEWVARDAFKRQYPDSMTAAEFVNKVFDTSGLEAFELRQQQIDAMTSSGKTRAQVLRDVVEITDLKSREYNPSFVLMQYFGYLQRDPDPQGYNFWLEVLNNREPNNYGGMVCSFITAAEYQHRFSSVVTHNNAECAR